MDECTEEGDRRSNLLDELRSLPPNTNVLVTSRHNSSIATEFHGTTTLEIDATNSDITRYILAHIKREHRLARHVKTDSVLQQSIVSEIVGRVKGMYIRRCVFVCTAAILRLTLLRFLLAQLHIDSLVDKSNRKAIYSALQRLVY